jgi:hypothetical protein
MSDKIPFTLREPRYDPNTYWGRVFSLAEASSVRYAFVRNADVMKNYNLVKAQEAREEKAMAASGSPKVLLTAAEIEELRHATNIVKAAIHPDT